MRIDRFVAELKRRRVFRVLGVYAVAAWAVIQISDVIVPNLGLPGWITRAVILLVALGFPFALALAWAFDITPDGVERTPSTESAPDSTPQQPQATAFFGGRAAGLVGIGMLIALVAFGAYASFNNSRDAAKSSAAGRDAKAASPTLDAIAVLPFVDMSPAHDQEYFSDGITEELLDQLAKISGLRVPARTSSFQFKGKGVDVRTVAAQLGVDAVLEGSVRKSGDRIRITAQLIDAKQGYHIWSQTYDRQLTDVFAIQDEITKSIVDTLKLKLGGAATQSAQAPTKSLAAHDLYLLGLYQMNRRSYPALQQAAAHFEKAIQEDTTFARAYAALANVHTLIPQYKGGVNVKAEAEQAKQFAAHALRLEPNLGEAHTALGGLLHNFDWNYAGAERELKRAIELNPNDVTAHQWYGELHATLGHFDVAAREHRRAVELDPLSPLQHMMYGLVLRPRDPAAASAELQKAATLDPTFSRALQNLMLEYLAGRRYDDALKVQRRLGELWRSPAMAEGMQVITSGIADPAKRPAAMQQLQRWESSPAHPNPIAFFASWHSLLGNSDSAYVWLDRAVAQRDPLVLWVRVLPTFEAIRADPRFPAFLAKLGQRP